MKLVVETILNLQYHTLKGKILPSRLRSIVIVEKLDYRCAGAALCTSSLGPSNSNIIT